MTRPAYDGSAPPPLVVNVESTKFCNLRCRMCIQFQEGATVKGPHMELDHFLEIAESVFPFIEIWQPSVAGEPIVTRHFDEMLDIAHSYGLSMDMTTNGTLRRGAVMDRVVRDLRSVQFSFDAPTKQTFEQIREGANFEEVVANIQHLLELCRRERPDNMPYVALSVTLMELNIRELPDLVDFAAEQLGVHHIQAMHVFPVTEEMRRASLARHPELAAECIREAAERARKQGIGLDVFPLDNIVSATSEGTGARAIASEGGHVAGLGRTKVGSSRSFPTGRKRSSPKAEYRGAEALANAGLPSRQRTRTETAAEDLPESLPFCDHLWNRAYVHLDNSVLPCCMPGAPVVGYLHDQPFHELWNNPNYRAMRQRLVAGDPVSVCRGCQYIQKAQNRAQIAMVLGDASVPSGDLLPEPEALGPEFARSPARRTTAAPTIRWDPAASAVGYRVEFSLDRFYGIAHSSGPIAAAASPTGYEVPIEVWRLAPAHRSVFWRVIAEFADATEREVAAGLLSPETPIWEARSAADRS